MAIKDYSTTPDMNTTISGINIAEGCAPSGINNAIRQLMADVKAEKEEREATQSAKDAAQDKAISAAQSGVSEAKQSVTSLDSALRALIAQEVAKCMLTTGGKMTGPILSDVAMALKGSGGSTYLAIAASTQAKTAQVVCCKDTHASTPGAVWIAPTTTDESNVVYFYPDGRILNSIYKAYVASSPKASAGVGQWVYLFANKGNALVLPSGGTWAYFTIWHADSNGAPATNASGGVAAGGTTVLGASNQYGSSGFAWRTA